MSRFSLGIFFVSQEGKNFVENLSDLCFRKLRVAKKYLDQREGGKRDYQNFLSNF